MPHAATRQTGLPTVPRQLAARGVTLRHRRDEDADFVRDVYVAYRWQEVFATGWPESVRLAFLHDQFRMQDLHYASHYPGAAWGIVEVGGEPAGRLFLYRQDDDLRIVDIAFMPAFRNQGLGGALLAAVLEQARAAGAAKVSIHVEQTNPALRLYERLGFEKVELHGIYHLLECRVG